MSSSVSLEASVSPTPPTHKMNGGPSHRHELNVGPLGASKHSLGTGTTTLDTPAGLESSCQPLLDLSRAGPYPGGWTGGRSGSKSRLEVEENCQEEGGIYQMLASLALLCLLSLLMSFLALFFLQKTGPAAQLDRPPVRTVVVDGEEHAAVYQVSVALSTLTVSLDLCCLFVCCIQFLLAIKLLKTPQGVRRTNKFLKRSSYTRVLAIGGFFLSIPLFFTGIILFTFIHFHELPAITTSVVIGLGIVFCGVASVQNVYLWQWEKTQASQALAQIRLSRLRETTIGPDVTIHNMELSTLV